MSAPRAVRLALTLAALATFAAADDVSDLLDKAKKTSANVAAPAAQTPASAQRSCTDGIPVTLPGRFCETVKDCRKFCSCACTFDEHKWKPNVKNDGSTTCPDAPKTGEGIVAPDSPDLSPLSAEGFSYITFERGERAGPAAIAGLRRLDAHLAASASREKHGYTVRVVSCYRPQLEDTEPECCLVLKSLYMLARVSDPEQVQYWQTKSDPNNLGLTWPGRTPHSAGYACDLVLVDRHGQDSFDARAGVVEADGPPVSSIKPRLASKLLDEEVTNPDVGGSRLTFEAWHYEWGDAGSGSRCKDPECNEKHWPVKGRP